MGFKTFKELKVWKLAREVRIEIFTLTKSFPKDEKFKLIDQLVRCSRGITANIAEGHGRFHYQENIQYCRMARGSNSELMDHLTVALDCEYLNESDFKILTSKCEEIERMLNGYIGYLQKQKSQA